MLRFSWFVFACWVVLPAAASAQGTDDRRSAQQIADSAEIAQLARTLTAPARTDSARAARLYEWVARNLTYDVEGFLRGRLADGKPEQVYRRRTAVCGGFVGLYERLAREAGLHVVPILGYAKGFTYRAGASTKDANHSWLAVSIDGRYRLIDPTWAAGFVNGRRFEPNFTWDYFLIPAEELILSHYPDEGKWQLLAKPMSRREFERLPLVPRNIVNVGFDAAAIRATALGKGVRGFPLVGARNDVRIIAAPISGTLPRASTVSVDLQWPAGVEVALVSGGVWRQLTRQGDNFRGEAVASEKALFLVGRTQGSKEFETLLQYQVQ